MNTLRPLQTPRSRILCAAVALTVLATPASALGAARPPVTPVGTLSQLPGASGCFVDQSKARPGCTSVRALKGPAPFLGSNAVAVSPDGRNVYVASSTSNAIAIFARSPLTGHLTQRKGPAGCIAAQGASGCARGVGLRGPNSVTVSPDGRSVYSTSLTSDAVTVFRRSPATGELRQAGDRRGCISDAPVSGCTTGRSLKGPDVVVVSPDGQNVYVGSFLGNAIAVFTRNPTTGALTQPSGETGCVAAGGADGCATGTAINAVEGLAISADGASVYTAAAVSNAVASFKRSASTGGLTQTGCIVDVALSGCKTGVRISGANAVTVSADDQDVYVTSLLSNTLTSFTRSTSSGKLTQKSGTSACVIYLLAVGCSLGRQLEAPEGVTVSPDGANVYASAFASGALDVFNRSTSSGDLIQKPRRPGCMLVTVAPDCTHTRGLIGVSSAAVSPDGQNLYAGAFGSNALTVFSRVGPRPPHGLGR